MMNQYKIAVIMTWFGSLPPYFPAWLRSAERNPDIDFLCFCDHEIQSEAPNIRVFPTTLQATLAAFEKALGRPVRMHSSYKFCDCRPFFGLAYAEYLKGYDFWGYCDIDLVFGRLRDFLTDEWLEKYDRFYPYGHLSVFRNCERINHLYDLPGGIYSRKEIFEGSAKTTPEEHFGLNRICDRNGISWYSHADFADFSVKYPKRLEVNHGLANYDSQCFVWKDGEALRVYRDKDRVCTEPFAYMHWQKRKPAIQGELSTDSLLVLTPDSLLALPGDTDILQLEPEKYNPPLTERDRKLCRQLYTRKKLREFAKCDLAAKRMWLRQKRYALTDRKRSYL